MTTQHLTASDLMKEKKYKVTFTESQLRLVAEAVEDWSRFLSGQCDLGPSIINYSMTFILKRGKINYELQKNSKRISSGWTENRSPFGRKMR